MLSRSALFASRQRFPAASQATANSFSLSKRFLSDDMRGRIDKAVQAHEVLVFMKGSKEAPQCGFSRAVVQILNGERVKYSTVNVLADEEVYVKGEFVGGCDILVKMQKDGDLTKLLKEKGLIQE